MVADGNTPDEAPRRRGRPRSEGCHLAILAATAELLQQNRYADVTIEGIAAHAKVAKQTLYKWWPSKAKLVMEAFSAHFFRRIPMPDTGAIDGDLRQFLNDGCRALGRGNSGQVFAGLIAAAQGDHELEVEFRDTFIAARRKVGTELLERGVARGELRPDTNVALVLDLLYGPIWYRLLLRNAPLDTTFANHVVDHVLASLRATKPAPQTRAPRTRLPEPPRARTASRTGRK